MKKKSNASSIVQAISTLIFFRHFPYSSPIYSIKYKPAKLKML